MAFTEDLFNNTSIDAWWTTSYQTGGSGSEGSGVLSLVSGANYIDGGNWQPSGIYQASITGDFDVKLKVSSFGSIPSSTTLAGIFFGFYIDSSHWAAIGAATEGSSTIFYGVYALGSGGRAGGNGSPVRNYYRLARVSSNIHLYYSTDGDTWTDSGAGSIAIGSGTGQIWISCNKDDGSSFTSTFDWVLDTTTSISSSSSKSSSSSSSSSRSSSSSSQNSSSSSCRSSSSSSCKSSSSSSSCRSSSSSSSSRSSSSSSKSSSSSSSICSSSSSSKSSSSSSSKSSSSSSSSRSSSSSSYSSSSSSKSSSSSSKSSSSSSSRSSSSSSSSFSQIAWKDIAETRRYKGDIDQG